MLALFEISQGNIVEIIKTRILCSRKLFLENTAVYELIWKHRVQQGRPQMTIRRMLFASRIAKATNTEYSRAGHR